MEITAAVVREKFGAFTIDRLELTDPRPDEALVRIVASGMCQTDLHGRDGYYNTPYPAVYGHEGAGVVQAVGNGVTKFAPGDHVVISFPWCGVCPNCRRNMQSHCMKGLDLKMRGTRADGSTLMRKGGAPVYSAFFQQSSFATHAIANERYMVKVRKDAPLELLGPFACSGQTGAGAVLNSMQPRAGDSFAVFGVGAVGLSGLMAAKIAGCDPIIAVDVHDDRLALARALGATHAINHRGRSDVVAEIRRITGDGVRFSLETSAQRPQRHGGIVRDAVPPVRPGGARRDPGRKPPAGVHPHPGRSPHARQNAGRADDDILPARRDQSRGAGLLARDDDQAGVAHARLSQSRCRESAHAWAHGNGDGADRLRPLSGQPSRGQARWSDQSGLEIAGLEFESRETPAPGGNSDCRSILQHRGTQDRGAIVISSGAKLD
jgi:aryl-alcohol dehydrogenase